MTRKSGSNQNAEIRERLAVVTRERDQLRALLESSRVMGCGYCGVEIGRYTGKEMPPPPEALAGMLDAFHKHDRECPKNPLAAEIRGLRAVLGLADNLASAALKFGVLEKQREAYLGERGRVPGRKGEN